MFKILALTILSVLLALSFLAGSPKEEIRIETPKKFGTVADDVSTLKNDATLNSQIDAVLSAIATKQSDYIKSSDTYFQGLSTHDIPPIYGSPTAPDKLARKPHYQAKNWTDFGQDNTALPFAIRINQMVYPDKSIGYQVIFLVTLNNSQYSKTRGYGLRASSFTHDWEYVK